jgi:hypothetical protein
MTSKPKLETNPADPGAERPSRKPSVARKTAPAKSGSPRSEGDGLATLSGDELNAMIARAAYLRAKQRGFEPGHEVEDWLAAEAEIRGVVAGGARDNG